MSQPKAPDSTLRLALLANAAFSAVSGATMILGSAPLGRLIGFDQPLLLAAVGAGLLVFAGGVYHNARRETVSRLEALATVIGDFAWVAGSALLIAIGPLSGVGNWLVAIVADVVLLFAALQSYGLYKLRQRQPA